jgi:predicted AAA+ superfamily ATPase
MHSGAGRILTVRMRPLAFSERGLVTPTVSLGGVFESAAFTVAGQSPLGLTDYVDELLRSGFPALRAQPDTVRADHLRSYIEHMVTKDIIEAGHYERRPAAMREWLRAYAAATATTATWETIRDAATPGRSTKPGRRTTEEYREALEALYVLDPLPAWVPSHNTMTRLTHAPKHHLADPALACAALQATKHVLLATGEPIARPAQGTLLGNLFESLVALSVRVYAQAIRAEVFHCRLKGGAREVDFIVSRGRDLVGIEVKLAPTVEDRDVQHLHWLRQSCGDAMRAGIVVTTGPQAYRRGDGIYVVPLALLGP